MAETSDTYRTPAEHAPAELNDGAHLNFHQGSPDLAPLEHIRLAREAMNHAISTKVEQPAIDTTPEIEADPVLTPAQISAAIVDFRQYVLDGQLFDEAA